MNYRSRKNRARLHDWYVCNRLGINYKEWKELSMGKKNLANDKLDKFMELTEPKKKEYINQEDEQRKIDEWFNKTTYDDFRNLMNNFKVKLKDIQDKIGCDKTTICTTMNRKYVSENGKALLYYYFNDENKRRKEYWKTKTKTKVKITKEGIEVSDNEKTPIVSVTKPTFTGIPYVPNSMISGLKHNGIEEKPSIASFVKKEEYDKVVKEKKQIEEELARYRYMIDLLRNQ